MNDSLIFLKRLVKPLEKATLNTKTNINENTYNYYEIIFYIPNKYSGEDPLTKIIKVVPNDNEERWLTNKYNLRLSDIANKISDRPLIAKTIFNPVNTNSSKEESIFSILIISKEKIKNVETEVREIFNTLQKPFDEKQIAEQIKKWCYEMEESGGQYQVSFDFEGKGSFGYLINYEIIESSSDMRVGSMSDYCDYHYISHIVEQKNFCDTVLKYIYFEFCNDCWSWKVYDSLEQLLSNI